MNMTGMNPGGGGPVGGGMMMMNNGGSPAMPDNSNINSQNLKHTLNTYIYDYFLKHGHYDIARQLVKEDKFEMRTVSKQSPSRRKDGEMNGDGDVMDMDVKDDIPDDLPRPQVTAEASSQGQGFLLDWFAIFHDIFAAHRGQKGSNSQITPAQQYLIQHQQLQRMRESQQNQNLARPGMMPNHMAAMRANQMRNNMVNGGDARGKLTPQQIQMMQQQKAVMQQQAQASMQRGDQGDNDPNARPATPAEGDNGGSPSKRPRLEGQQFNGNMMPNGRPGVPTAGQQNMMLQGGFNPNMNQAQFRQNGGIPPKMPGQMANGMMNMQNSGSPMMQAMNQFSADNMTAEMYNNRMAAQVMPGGPGAQSGNHALQDYQMQLMLLEQQNKKRLMMARQEQHENNPGRDGQPMPGVNMPPGMSPSGGSRSGTSPNPAEMKRTPQMGMPGSPSAGEMAGRSPAGMNFMNGMNNMGQDFGGPMFMKDGQAMMAPGGPNMRPPTSVDMNPMNRQQQQQTMRVAQFPGGQPMVQQQSQGQPQAAGTPGQRNTEMPPPQAPPGNNSATRNQPASPANSNAPPTPSQTNKPNPKNKKGKDEGKPKRPAKKGSTTNAPAEDNPAATTTPSTPITPQHNNNFTGSTNKGPAQGVQQNNQQPHPNQAMPPNQPPMLQQDLNQGFGYSDAPDPPFNLDFSTLEHADVLENFDFDSFLNTSADDTSFAFDGGMENFGMDGSE